ncbi:cytochrome c [Nocardioides marmoriginsengisoli]|uniref:cytochrome bc1 complex diheme cytochrome c subunit n=1 Tax=Nocardioides marmoriginsengisoli TaxID=661483 RepID=UPI001FE501BE|nr:cytochrome c [Nocardioides marmoriginsengisoli]
MRLLTRKISARLSARRRSRLAAPAVLILGLLAAGGVALAMNSAVSPATAHDSTQDAEAIKAGRALFAVSCSSCHGMNAEGIITKRGTNYGPSLIGVGAAAVDFQLETGRMPMAQPGAQAVKKRPVFTEDEVAAIAAYVASLGPGPAIPDKEAYDVSEATTEEIVKGGEFFRTNCTACHNFAGTGGALPKGKFAPSLIGVTGKHMYEAMVTGPQQMPVFSDAVLSPEDKRAIIAYLKNQEKTPNYGGFDLGSFGPVSEGMFAWLLGIGGLTVAGIWITSQTARSKKTIKKGADA